MIRKKHIVSFVIIAIMATLVGYYLDQKIIGGQGPEKYRLEILQDSVYDSWYYEIYIYDDLAVRQMFMPGIAQKQPFLNKEDAEKVGRLVIEKIKNGDSPHISHRDLNELQISF